MAFSISILKPGLRFFAALLPLGAASFGAACFGALILSAPAWAIDDPRDVNRAATTANTMYRGGDNLSGFWFYTYPSCSPMTLMYGSTTCSNCCSTPDIILKDQIAGPGQLGTKSLDEWYLEDLWPLVSTHIAAITNQITSAISSQATSVGSLIEAQNNVQSLASLQKRQAKSAHNYMPSESVCRFGSVAQSLSASDAAAKAVQISMIKRAQDRELLKANSNAGRDADEATPGQSADKQGRWAEYKNKFCDPSDIAGALSGICQGSKDTQYNRDIDFASSVAVPKSLDLTGKDGTQDIENVTALAENLYSHDVFNNWPNAADMNPERLDTPESQRRLHAFMDMRSLIAKRSVAENSFAAITAMKTKGGAGPSTYMNNLMAELGVSEQARKAAIGSNPSYYAQMETLSKTLYQTPSFYVNLMDSETNVTRQQAAMKAVELMQQRDIYEAMARSEMLLAVLLETYIDRQRGQANLKALQSE